MGRRREEERGRYKKRTLWTGRKRGRERGRMSGSDTSQESIRLIERKRGRSWREREREVERERERQRLREKERERARSTLELEVFNSISHILFRCKSDRSNKREDRVITL